MRISLFILLLLIPGTLLAEEHPLYAVAELPTPVWNIPTFPTIFGGPDGATLRLDHCGQMRGLEFVALPGSVFTIKETIASGTTVIFRVTSRDYPYPAKTGYFIDSRFVKTVSTVPPEQPRLLPPKETVVANLLAARGSIYVWGGNYRSGIPKMLALYPPAPALSPEQKKRWTLQGVDCSGLLYEATNGTTPRNVSALLTYGQAVAIAGLTIEQIMEKVAPLDLIVRQRHVQIILDRQRVIESRLGCKQKNGGVVIRPLREVLTELMESRAPTDDPTDAAAGGGRTFVIRRWYKGE